MASRPSEFLNWIPDNTTNILEPSSGQKNTGWAVGQKPPAQFTNWQINLIDQWLQYLDSEATAWPNVFVDDETSLADAITTCTTNGGGVICLRQSFSIVSSHTIPVNTMLIGREGLTVITIGSSATISLSTNAVVQNVWFVTIRTSGNLVQMSGNSSRIYNCNFTVSSTNPTVCVSVAADACGIESCVFKKVSSPSSAIGIQFEIGYTDNYEQNNTFYS